jgi:glycosyltransferase involved in cell wall biosynthesis
LHYLEQVDTVNSYTVIVPSKDLNFWQPKNPNFSVVAGDFPNYSFAEQTKFKKFLDELAPDLVHFCMPQQPIRYKGKTVTTFHDLSLLRVYNSDKNWLVYHAKQLVGRYVFKRVAKQTNRIITPTDFVKQDVAVNLKVPLDKITRTYEAADITIEATTPYTHPFKKYLLYVGQQSDYKNIPRLAAAHQKLLETHPDLGLILVGKLNAGARANKELFEKNDYKNIVFTDFIPNSQRDWLYQHAEAYIFPSLTEGFGLPGLEAMGYGAPVISSDATCLPEVYGDAAQYFNPLDIDNIATSIDTVISDETLQKELARKGYFKIKEYSWKRMAEQTLQVYNEVLTNSPEK